MAEGRSYGYAGTVLQLQADVIFLSARCGPLLDGDPGATRAAVMHSRRRRWEYHRTVPAAGGGTCADGQPEPPPPPPPPPVEPPRAG